ncbi:hypothetical protein ACSBPH_08445 [Microbacterium sp. F51-2R]|uniref:hypothetical protein n=1 Tax=Microbacterium sp. F51-2R TaxID=3445777 RepID=UPI003F9F20BB
MELEFRGWKHDVRGRKHTVRAVGPRRVRSLLGEVDDPKTLVAREESGPEFSSAWTARGYLEDLSLGGNYLVTFNLSRELLDTWLDAFIEESPADALAFLQAAVKRARAAGRAQ